MVVRCQQHQDRASRRRRIGIAGQSRLGSTPSVLNFLLLKSPCRDARAFLLPKNRKEVRDVVTRLDLFNQLDVVLASRLICALGKLFDNPEDLEKHLSRELAEEELQQINDAALKEGNQPLSFSFKQ